jgi:hypothetical protein
MSKFSTHGRRCDKCGKVSRNRNTGEYTRKDGTCGYIWPDEADDSKNACDDCLEHVKTELQTQAPII